MKQPPTYSLMPPEDLRLINVRPLPKVAGGSAAVWSSMKIGLRQMGVMRAAESLLKVNQKGGFDCPGCAWPDPDDRRSMVEFCENGAKAVAEEATRKVIGREFFSEWSIDALLRQSDIWLGQQGRLGEPLVRFDGKDHYEAVSWEKAFELIAAELNNLTHPDAAAFYTSGRTSNEAAFLYQLFVRMFGTNNLPDCSNMCHESSGYALTETIGVGKGTVTLDDFAATDLIIVVGQNPGTNHPRMLATLQAAKRRGCQILSINPLKEVGLERFGHPQELGGWIGRGGALADHHLPLRINGDVALLQAFAKSLLDKNSPTIDRSFIEEKTSGFEPWRRSLETKDVALLLQEAGLSAEQFAPALAMVKGASKIIVTWAMGLTQHKNAVGNIREIVNLLLLTGNIGKKGAGVCPVRGHSNVQGDRTMGICERPSESFLDNLERVFAFSAPRRHGVDVVGAIEGMKTGAIQAFVGLGGNFLSASPDSDATADALSKCNITVHVSTKLNRSHLRPGKLSFILPALARSDIDQQKMGEQFVTVENSMGIVHSSRGNLRPVSAQMRSEPWIVAQLAKATLSNEDKFQEQARPDWSVLADDYDGIRNLIAETIPGFVNFNERVRQPAGFYLPNPVRDHCVFQTKTGKANFSINQTSDIRLNEDELMMMTIRSHDQYNTTIYGLDDRYRGISGGRRVVFICEKDMLKLGFEAGETIDLTSHYNNKIRRAEGFRIVPYAIPPGCIATYFPEANSLVPTEQVAEGSRTPISKSVVVRLEKLKGSTL